MLKTLSSVVQTAVTGAVQGMLGEEFSKHYETPKDPTASGGHELVWKIFPAVSRKTNAEVSIFVFDKDDLSKKGCFKRKEEQERYLDVLRGEIKTLRVLRHPHVLKVVEVFEESRRTLSFVTERVTCSLANACKNFNNVSNVVPEVLEIGLTDFELACGLMHIGEALGFLHREGRRVHMSLGPHSIFITPKGEWKLGGMGFCRVVESGKLSRSEYYALGDGDGTGYKNLQTGVLEGLWEPPLQYCAPEVVNEPRLFNSSADMFSLGLLVFELFVPPRADGCRDPVISVRDGNKVSYTYKVQSLHPIHFPPTVPVSIQNTIRSLLSLEPANRPEARTFLASQYFDSGPIKTLRVLQSLVEQDPATQARFLTTLPDQLDEFSPRTLRDMVIPVLQALVLNKQVAPFTITPLLRIVKKLDKQTFMARLASIFIPLLTITEPVQCMLMFVSELETLIPKAEDNYIRDHIVPMLCRSLDSTVPEILDTVLNKIVDQASLFEYRILKQVILPRVNKLILQPPQLSVRVNALLWLAKSFHVFDKDLLIESVIPTLGQTIQADKSPAVCMCILGCYDNLGKHLGPEFIAKNIIPAIAPLLWEKDLNSQQFDCVCEKIQDMLKCVISERDKVFNAESSVNAISSGVPALSIASNYETQVASAGYATSRDDTMRSSSTNRLDEREPQSGTKNESFDSQPSRRRSKKGARRRKSGGTANTNETLLDLPVQNPSSLLETDTLMTALPTNSNVQSAPTAFMSAAPVPAQGMAGHALYTANRAHAAPMNFGTAGYDQPNNGMLVAYGLQPQQQANLQMSNGYPTTYQQQYPNVEQYGRSNATNLHSTYSRPNNILQIQSGYPQPENGDKFSAFDGI